MVHAWLRSKFNQLVENAKLVTISAIVGAVTAVIAFFLVFAPMILQLQADVENLNMIRHRLGDDVQRLEDERLIIFSMLRNSTKTIDREREIVEDYCSRRLLDVRALVNKYALENSKLDIYNKQVVVYAEDLKHELGDIRSQYNVLKSAHGKLSDRRRELEKEVERLSLLLDDTKIADLEDNLDNNSKKEEVPIKDEF